MNTEPTLTLAQVAQRLSMGALEVKRMIRTEQMPVIRQGRKMRVPKAFVDELIERGWGGGVKLAADEIDALNGVAL